jgi:hypothetical protein
MALPLKVPACRNDAVVFLGAAVREAKAGDDLVEDERHVVAARGRPQPGQEARRRDDRALVGLDEHRRQLIVMGGDQRLGGRQVVVGRDQHLALEGVRHAGRVGHGRRERLGRARHDAHQRVVVRAVKATLEFHDLLALAKRARHAQGKEGRLRAR